MGSNETNVEAKFVTLGAADTFYRVLLSTMGNYLVNNLSLCYIGSVFVGMVMSILSSYQTGSLFTTFFCICKNFSIYYFAFKIY